MGKLYKSEVRGNGPRERPWARRVWLRPKEKWFEYKRETESIDKIEIES